MKLGFNVKVSEARCGDATALGVGQWFLDNQGYTEKNLSRKIATTKDS